MLKVFRDNLKNLAWILWVIIALFVLALAADFGSRAPGRGNETAVARVGGETISRQEFQRAYQNMTSIYRQVYGDQLSPDIEKQMYRQTLTQTVVQKIQTLEARQLGLTRQRRRAARPDPLLPDLQGRAGALRRRAGLRPGDPGGAPHHRRRLRAGVARPAPDQEAHRRPLRQPLRQRGRDPARLPRPGGAREDPLRRAAAHPLRPAGDADAERGRGLLPGPPAGVQAPRAARRGLPAGQRHQRQPAGQPGPGDRSGPPQLLRRPQGRVRPGGAGPRPPHPGDVNDQRNDAAAGRGSRRPRRSSTPATTSPSVAARVLGRRGLEGARGATSALSAATGWSRSSRTRRSARRSARWSGR